MSRNFIIANMHKTKFHWEMFAFIEFTSWWSIEDLNHCVTASFYNLQRECVLIMRRSKLFVGIFWVFLNSSAKIMITNQITTDWSMMGRKISQKSNKTCWIDSTKPKFPSTFRSNSIWFFFQRIPFNQSASIENKENQSKYFPKKYFINFVAYSVFRV